MFMFMFMVFMMFMIFTMLMDVDMDMDKLSNKKPDTRIMVNPVPLVTDYWLTRYCPGY
jgi:hypothetical protein